MPTARKPISGLPHLLTSSFWRSGRGKFWAFGLGLLGVAVANMVVPTKQGQSAREENLRV